MQAPVWLWEGDYPASLGPGDAAVPASAFYVKCTDGLTWHAGAGAGAYAVASAADLARVKAERYPGVAVVGWSVINLKDPADPYRAVREAELVAECASALQHGAHILDLEPHEVAPDGTVNYVRDDLGAGDLEIADFCSAAAANGVKALWLSVDARPGRLGPISLGAWAAQSLARYVLPQVYFDDFHTQPAAAIDTAIAALRAQGWTDLSRVFPLLPGDAHPIDLMTAVAYAREQGLGGFNIYRRGNLSPGGAAAVAALPDPWAPSPAAPAADPPIAIVADAAALYEYVMLAGAASSPAGVEVAAVHLDDRGRRVIEMHRPQVQ